MAFCWSPVPEGNSDQGLGTGAEALTRLGQWPGKFRFGVDVGIMVISFLGQIQKSVLDVWGELWVIFGTSGVNWVRLLPISGRFGGLPSDCKGTASCKGVSFQRNGAPLHLCSHSAGL